MLGATVVDVGVAVATETVKDASEEAEQEGRTDDLLHEAQRG